MRSEDADHDALSDDREAVRTAATELADLSHRPVGDWTDETREQAITHLETLSDAEHLDDEIASDLQASFDQWKRAGLSEGEQAKAVHDLRNDVLPELPEAVVLALVRRSPDERDLSGGDPETAWQMLAPRMPADRWDADDREHAAHYCAVLAAADVYPDHARGLIDRLAEWEESDREDLLDALREYAQEARECVQARADEQAGGWRSEYETTTYRGPDRYPVPEDWTLDIVEGDGSVWRRPPRPDDAERGWEYEDRASTLNEFDYENDEQTVKFDVNGDPAFTVTNPDRDELMGSIAEVLWRVARGEDYSGVVAPEGYGASDDGKRENESSGEQNASLGDFGGGGA
jgi:hypothetical protein